MNLMEWINVFETVFEYEAYLVAGLLEDYDIPVKFEGNKFSAEPVNVSSLSSFKIFVPDDYLKQTVDILADFLEENSYD